MFLFQESKFSLALIAAQQNQLVGGKDITEIQTIAKDVTIRRQKKYQYARFSDNLHQLIDQFEHIESHSNLSINVGAEKIYGVKKIDSKIDPNCVRNQISDFFRDFSKYRVQNDLLKQLNNFYNKINRKHGQIFGSFNEKIDWTDKRAFEPYFNMLQAWFKDEDNRKKSNENTSSKKSLNMPRNKTQLEDQFEKLVTVLHEDREYIANSLHDLHQFIKQNKELTKRFGDVPTFKDDGIINKLTGSSSGQDISKFIEPTLHVIRFYWLSFRILTYMRHLYNCNELFAIEMDEIKQENVYIDDGNHQHFDYFLDRVQEKPLNVANEACQLYMEENCMNCAPVRYLMAYQFNVNYQSYVQSGYHELTKKESFNSFSSNIDILWIYNHHLYAVIVDEKYRDLVQVQSEILQRYSDELKNELEIESKYDYRQLADQQHFVFFYDKAFRSAIIEWIEGYLALTNDQTLLQNLNHRFYIDGCHLTPFELQYILLSSVKLQKDNQCNINFILLLCNSVSQNEIINVLLYMQIIYYRGQRFGDTKIYEALQLIENARHKALFSLKLNEYHEDIDPDQIYKLILMIQHSSNGSEQLEKMSLNEWIDVANKQKWSEIGALIRKYGEVGYYLGFLDDRERKNEERMMRKVFDSVQYIPEILIAKVSQFIVNNEVHGNEDYFNKLRILLESGNDFTDLEILEEKRPYLITREFEQQKFIKYIAEQRPKEYKALLPNEERKIDDMINLMTGLHDDTEELKVMRQKEIHRIGDMVKVDRNTSLDLQCYLSSFDILDIRKAK